MILEDDCELFSPMFCVDADVSECLLTCWII